MTIAEGIRTSFRKTLVLAGVSVTGVAPTVRETTLPRETLYMADEVFFVGTAVEVTPIRSVDRVKVGRGRRGPITEAIQQRFFQIVNGEAPDTHGWLQPVNVREAATSGAVKSR